MNIHEYSEKLLLTYDTVWLSNIKATVTCIHLIFDILHHMEERGVICFMCFSKIKTSLIFINMQSGNLHIRTLFERTIIKLHFGIISVFL